MVHAVSVALVFILGLVSCGGPTRDQVVRSEREYDLAVGLYGEHDVEGAFEHLLEAIQLDPENSEAHLLLGKLFIARADFTRAEHHLREAIRTNEAIGGPERLPSDARNSLGVLFIRAERYDEAVEVLEEAASDLMNRGRAVTRSNLAWAYLELERPQEAVRVLLEAIQESPNSCLALYRLGQARVTLEQWEPALEALDRGLGFEAPECQGLQAAWHLRCEVHAHLGNREEATADCERCVELSGDTTDGRACRALLDAAP